MLDSKGREVRNIFGILRYLYTCECGENVLLRFDEPEPDKCPICKLKEKKSKEKNNGK